MPLQRLRSAMHVRRSIRTLSVLIVLESMSAACASPPPPAAPASAAASSTADGPDADCAPTAKADSKADQTSAEKASPVAPGACPAGEDEALLEERFEAEGELLPGKGCTAAALPEWRYDPKTRLATLEKVKGIEFPLPSEWEVIEERPQLLVVRGALDDARVRPTFELFVRPKCDSVESIVTHARIAARALLALKSPRLTRDAVREGKWSVGLGAIGRSIVLGDVSIETHDGPRVLTLYSTDVATAPTFVISAAAACPGPVPATSAEGFCQKAYRRMLGL